MDIILPGSKAPPEAPHPTAAKPLVGCRRWTETHGVIALLTSNRLIAKSQRI
jgi:hypothetical protein